MPVNVCAREYVGDFARGVYVGDFARGAFVGIAANSCGGTVFVLERALFDGLFARGCVDDFVRGVFVGDFARPPFVGDFARPLFVGDFVRGDDLVCAPFVGDFARGAFVGDFARGDIVTGLGPGGLDGDFARGASDARISCTVRSAPTRVIWTSARRVPMRTSTGSSVGVRSAIIVAIGEPRSTDVSWSALSGRAVRFVRPFAVRIAIGRPTPSTTSVTPSRSRYPSSWSS